MAGLRRIRAEGQTCGHGVPALAGACGGMDGPRTPAGACLPLPPCRADSALPPCGGSSASLRPGVGGRVDNQGRSPYRSPPACRGVCLLVCPAAGVV